MSELPEDPAERERVIEEATGFTVEYDGKTRSGEPSSSPSYEGGDSEEWMDGYDTKLVTNSPDNYSDEFHEKSFNPNADAWEAFSEFVGEPEQELEEDKVAKPAAKRKYGDLS